MRTLGPAEDLWQYATSDSNFVALSGTLSSDSALLVYDFAPDATARAILLAFPPGTTYPGQYAFADVGAIHTIQLSDHQIQWLWQDSDSRDTYLSTWRLP